MGERKQASPIWLSYDTPLFGDSSLLLSSIDSRAWHTTTEETVKLSYLHGTLHLQELVRVKERQQQAIIIDDIIRFIT